MEGANQAFINGLQGTERLILLMHWGDHCTVDEVACVLRLDPRAVRTSIESLRERAMQMMALSPSSFPARSPGPLHRPCHRS